jgi:hypothetical protein
MHGHTSQSEKVRAAGSDGRQAQMRRVGERQRRVGLTAIEAFATIHQPLAPCHLLLLLVDARCALGYNKRDE